MSSFDRLLIAFSVPLGFLFGALAMAVAALFAVAGWVIGPVFLGAAGCVVLGDQVLDRFGNGILRRPGGGGRAEVTRMEHGFARQSRLSRVFFAMGFAAAVCASLIWSVETVTGFVTVIWPA